MTLWTHYRNEVESMGFRGRNQRLLWHGTRNNKPEDLYKKDGLNVIYSQDGMWGAALYFAENLAYSCPTYAYPVPNGIDGKPAWDVFLANVVLGDFKELPSTRGLKAPPMKPNSDIPFDSVKGNT
jgi:hypothetical protein